jgi:molecular chaperone Hsp33
VIDRLARVVAAKGTVRGLAAVTTSLVEEARARHGTMPTATAALGRALTGALLLAATLKRDERLSLEFVGDGPLRGVLVDATPSGDVRGFVTRPGTHLPPKRGKLDVGGALGSGNLCVMRVPLDRGSLYRSVVPLQSGEIGEDIAHYLATSVQVPSVVGLGVFVSADGQASALVREHRDAEGMLRALLESLAPQTIGGHAVRFHCRCDPDRARRAVLAMGREEIERALTEDGAIETSCEFCGDHYPMSEAEVRALLT